MGVAGQRVGWQGAAETDRVDEVNGDLRGQRKNAAGFPRLLVLPRSLVCRPDGSGPFGGFTALSM